MTTNIQIHTQEWDGTADVSSPRISVLVFLPDRTLSQSFDSPSDLWSFLQRLDRDYAGTLLTTWGVTQTSSFGSSQGATIPPTFTLAELGLEDL